MHQNYRPPTPDVRDDHARTLLWIVLVILICDVAMNAYVFYVVHHTVTALQHLSDSLSNLGDPSSGGSLTP